ncbi:MAG: cellulase family glycosylhydrolase [Bacteroidales bacterium]|nr:cellulase family glycosylhydrolase [Bacteroidales bacterium]
MKKWTCLLLVIAIFGKVSAQFTRGINLTNWFQVSNAKQIQFSKFTFKDFQQIKSLGCDVIRLPINLHAMTSGAPDYKLDPIFVGFLDSVVNWCETLQLHLIIDNHTFDPAANTPVTIGEPLTKIWHQMAKHYKDRSKYIYYEVLNEPHGISESTWGRIQQRVIDTIRLVDTIHTIIVGPANWNSYQSLKNLPHYTDNNLIYTFHFYDPFIFTHQGASWASLTDLRGVPYPYDAARMPSCPPSYKGSWIENELKFNYIKNGTDSAVKKLLDIAIEFKNSRNVKIYCGEFGVYNAFAPDSDRVYWYQVVREYLEQNNVPWTIWDYKGAFGIFEKGSNEMFEHDLNIPILNALGFNIPEQTELVIKPDSTEFFIYRDYIESGINESSYTGNNGAIDYYSQNKPNNDNYCIEWKVGEQYTSIGLDFVPNKDLSLLKDSMYALCFWVRGYGNNSYSFDVRFIDSKTGETDHPWRNRYTINSSMASWDGYWHKLYLPLKNFTEHGSWDNGWYNPEGKFDWRAIDRLEIVSEHMPGNGMMLWFDNIHITNRDTCNVLDTSRYIPPTSKIFVSNLSEFVIYPNPVTDRLYIKPTALQTGSLKITFSDLSGRIVAKKVIPVNSNSHAIELEISGMLKTGVYLMTIESKTQKTFGKIVVR